MNVIDASRGVLVAHARVREALERGAKDGATPEDLAVALVALDSAVGILRSALNSRDGDRDRCACTHARRLHKIDPDDPDGLRVHCEGCGWCREFRLAYAST